MSEHPQGPPTSRPPPARRAPSSRVSIREDDHYPPSSTTSRRQPQRNASTATHMSANKRAASSRRVNSHRSHSHHHQDQTPTAPPRRPTYGLRRGTTLQTRYMEMLLDLDKVPRSHNLLAAFFGWLLLAGFVVFPGTFTSIQQLATDPSLAAQLPNASAILNRIQNLPLVIVAGVVCGIGTAGLLWLAARWRRNTIWLLTRIFLPGASNAVAGLISTFVTVYTQKDGDWSVMARATGAVEAGTLIVCGVAVVLCTVMMQWVKRKHRKAVKMLEKEEAEEAGVGDGDGVVG